MECIDLLDLQTIVSRDCRGSVEASPVLLMLWAGPIEVNTLPMSLTVHPVQ